MKSIPSCRHVATIAALLLLTPWLSFSAEKPDTRPCILLVTADDMNCDSVGAFGCKASPAGRSS